MIARAKLTELKRATSKMHAALLGISELPEKDFESLSPFCRELIKSALEDLGVLDTQLKDEHICENNFKAGDIVRISHDICDAYSEIWHSAGAKLEVTKFSDDGQGVMFASGLGIHFSQCKLVKRKKS